MSDSESSPYHFKFTASEPPQERSRGWSRAALLALWLLPNAIGCLTFLISLVGAGRPGYRMWLQAFGFVALPCGAVLFFTSLAAVAKKWDAVLVATAALYAIISIAWLGICNGGQVFEDRDQTVFTIVGVIWLGVNAALAGGKFVRWLRR